MKDQTAKEGDSWISAQKQRGILGLEVRDGVHTEAVQSWGWRKCLCNVVPLEGTGWMSPPAFSCHPLQPATPLGASMIFRFAMSHSSSLLCPPACWRKEVGHGGSCHGSKSLLKIPSKQVNDDLEPAHPFPAPAEMTTCSLPALPLCCFNELSLGPWLPCTCYFKQKKH